VPSLVAASVVSEVDFGAFFAGFLGFADSGFLEFAGLPSKLGYVFPSSTDLVDSASSAAFFCSPCGFDFGLFEAVASATNDSFNADDSAFECETGAACFGLSFLAGDLRAGAFEACSSSCRDSFNEDSALFEWEIGAV
jgi:hypothetical protein